MSTTSKHLPPQRNEESSGLRFPRGGHSAGRSRLQTHPRVDAIGRPDRYHGADVMGGPDRYHGIDVMGGPDRYQGVDVMGGPDRGPRLDVMGESDLGFVDSVFTGQTNRVGAV